MPVRIQRINCRKIVPSTVADVASIAFDIVVCRSRSRPAIDMVDGSILSEVVVRRDFERRNCRVPGLLSWFPTKYAKDD